MNKWFFFNLFLLLIAVWKVMTSYGFPVIQIHILFGIMGLFFILFNWTRHAVFSTIRDTPDRRKKIKFANLSKKAMPFHRWTGTTALIIILFHAGFVLNRFGLHLENPKIISGLIAASLLTGVVISGWMRRIKPSGTKRIVHLRLGLTMFFLVLLHVLL
ncbi:hypothetical protein CIL05_03595 [Virgibacillus profundi]|uniref:Ferric oxidoreductase domain-containing protein n=1 Tax=Virgibacillus profundi TaxID=2024555 RepID=A0A2A2IHL4_9BACI|nr:hypothetical protein [Virgibacillus profundi]PAV30816.1 hypothetical protein CIL05_03595 [Virgibacillus profundi]PXY54999.1 hypothetical protein CIT14_03675 [Virgibacillus profundi]